MPSRSTHLVACDNRPLTILQGGRTALLRHELPDGEGHFDWLMQSVGPDEAAGTGPDQRSLAAFRLAARVDRLRPGQSLEATRIDDHRVLYLDYDGPVSGSRGSVKHVASGRVESVQRQGQHDFALTVRWIALPGDAGSQQSLRLTLKEPGTDSRAAQPLEYVVRCAASDGAAQ